MRGRRRHEEREVSLRRAEKKERGSRPLSFFPSVRLQRRKLPSSPLSSRAKKKGEKRRRAEEKRGGQKREAVENKGGKGRVLLPRMEEGDTKRERGGTLLS